MLLLIGRSRRAMGYTQRPAVVLYEIDYGDRGCRYSTTVIPKSGVRLVCRTYLAVTRLLLNFVLRLWKVWRPNLSIRRT